MEILGLDAALAREWDALADRTGDAPFLRPGFVGAWGEAFGVRIGVAAVRSGGGELRALLPVVAGRGVLRSPADWHSPVFGPLAADEEAAAELARGLLARRVRRLAIDFADPGALAPFRAAARAAGFRVHERMRQLSPYLPLEGDPEARLSAKRRSNLRRLRRKLEAEGRLEVVVHEEMGAFDAFLAVEASGWKNRAGTAIRASEDVRRFYAAVGAWAQARGWLRILLLCLDGRPIAGDLGIEDGRRHHLLKTGYDPAYRSFAAGVQLRREAIARARGLGLESYEFLGHVEPTKLEWTDACRERVLLEAFAPTPAGHAERLVRTRGRELALRTQARLAERKAR